ncbi:hypothetical protein [Allomuricauda sp. d1]|uniref:hypothetical protein n=1 Tax=Allomuricauda sp. d1 TaxID=3136725 RepID=UPI0031DD92C4
MSIKKLLFLIFSIFLFNGCIGEVSDDFDCSAVSCIGPPVFIIEVIQNDENVIENDIYSLENITISGDSSDDFDISIYDPNSDSIPRLLIQNNQWKVGVIEFNLNFSADFTFQFNTEIGLSTGQCCGGIPRLESLQIDGQTREPIDGIYTLILE